MTPRTLYDKLWDAHVVHDNGDGTHIIYIDRHLTHEVTSPQAFEGLRLAGRKLWRRDAVLAVPDHNVPTADRGHVRDPISRAQLDALQRNAREWDLPYIDLFDERQGIVHVIGPELGASLPGMTIVCGDSHTTTNGGLGAWAFGIGTSEVEHVLATQTLVLAKSRNMRVTVNGTLAEGVTSKDIALHLIGRIGTAGATGHVIEFAGSTVGDLTIEGRLTLCNMSIEAGARSGLVAVDESTIDYVRGRPMAPTGKLWEAAAAAWRGLVSDPGARFDREVEIAAEEIRPCVTWGTSPEMVVTIDGAVPDPESESDPVRRQGMRNALAYMELRPGTPMRSIAVDKVFIGSCTNARIEDLRAAAAVARGRRVAKNVRVAMVVPGSGLVKRQAEREGLHRVFLEAGFLWREPGCSMCLGMNEDRLSPGERCASTSNRNFEGRQGPGGRTHLVSPPLAAAAAIAGHFADVRDL
jgi:3-isopropylmalate/(R)-2-methylmalate dehydratase large subunit